MAYIYDLVDTWNNAAVTFTAIKMNVTDTNSASGSLLMDLRVGGTSRFNVNKLGTVSVLTSFSGTGLTYTNGQGYGLVELGHAAGGEGRIVFNSASASAAGISYGNPGIIFGKGSSLDGLVGIGSFGNDLILLSSVRLTWGSSLFSGADLFLTRRAAASLRLGAADTSASATITVTIASPGVVTWSSHGLATGTPVVFSTTGALPTGITAATTYYVIVVDANTFQLATSFANALAGTAVNTSGSQSGTHTGRRGAIAQTLGVQDTLSTSSLENIDGADFVIRGSRGIGNKPGGSIVFQVAPAGSTGTAQNALEAALTLASASGAGGQGALFSGRTGAPYTEVLARFASYGVTQFAVMGSGNPRGVFVGSGCSYGFASSNSTATTTDDVDVRLSRDAANTLALRNGTNAQTFRVYNTTDGTNSEWLGIGASSNIFRISANATGTGTARSIQFTTSGGSIDFGTGNESSITTIWRIAIGSGGHLICPTDNTYDIGAYGATRPRNLYLGSSIVLPAYGVIVYDGRAEIRSYANGNLTFWNSAGTDFGRLQFGGTSSSFPALKRSGTSLQVRLADDSNFANLSAAEITASISVNSPNINSLTSIIAPMLGAL